MGKRFIFVSVLLLLIRSLTCCIFNHEIRTDKLLPVSLLDQFKNNIRFIHFDNSALTYVSYILMNSKAHVTSILKNYDAPQQYENELKNSNIFHVVLLTETLLQNLYERKSELIFNSIIFIIEIKRIWSKKKYMPNKSFHQSRAVFIFNPNEENLSHCCFYWDGKVATERKIAVEDRLPKLVYFLNNFTNFEGYEFKIGYGNTTPLFYTSNENNHTYLHGPEYKILSVLSLKLNFSYKLQVFRTTNISTKQQMISEVASGNLDWSLGGISITYDRSMIIDYMTSIFSDEFVAVVALPEASFSNWMYIIYSYFVNNLVLVKIGLSVSAIATIIKLSVKIFGGSVKTIWIYVEMVGLALIDQSIVNLNRNISNWRKTVKILFLGWLLLSYNVTTFFKMVLTTKYMHVDYSEPSSLKDIIDKGFAIEAVTDDYNFLNQWCSSVTDKCNKLFQIIHLSNDSCDSIRKMFRKKISYVMEDTPLRHILISNKCNITKTSEMYLKLVNLQIGSGTQSWIFKKFTPYVTAFSKKVDHLSEAGLIQYWYKTESMKVNNEFYKKARSNVPVKLRLEHFISPFLFLLCAHVLSFLVFLAEIFNLIHV